MIDKFVAKDLASEAVRSRHSLCRFVQIARKSFRSVAVYDFPVISRSDELSEERTVVRRGDRRNVEGKLVLDAVVSETDYGGDGQECIHVGARYSLRAPSSPQNPA